MVWGRGGERRIAQGQGRGNLSGYVLTRVASPYALYSPDHTAARAGVHRSAATLNETQKYLVAQRPPLTGETERAVTKLYQAKHGQLVHLFTVHRR